MPLLWEPRDAMFGAEALYKAMHRQATQVKGYSYRRVAHHAQKAVLLTWQPLVRGPEGATLLCCFSRLAADAAADADECADCCALCGKTPQGVEDKTKWLCELCGCMFCPEHLIWKDEEDTTVVGCRSCAGRTRDDDDEDEGRAAEGGVDVDDELSLYD